MDGGRRGDVLERHAGAVEDDDLVGRPAARLPSGDDLAELGGSLPREEPGRERVVEIAERRALLGDVGDERGGGEEVRLDLLLVFVVRSDGGEKRPGAEKTAEDKGSAKGCM